MAKSRASEDFFRCPHCGAKVRCGAAACPECGSDDDTGWSWDADPWAENPSEGWEDEDSDEAYDQFLADEFPDHASASARRNQGLAWYWKLAAILLLLSFVLGFFL